MLKQFDRVALIRNFKTYDMKEIKAGTIGTYRTLIQNDTVIVQYDYDYQDDNPKFAGIPISLLRLATENEIKALDDPFKILPKTFHKNDRYIVLNENNLPTIGTIDLVELDINEQDDAFLLLVGKDEKLTTFKKDYLENYASYASDFNMEDTKTAEYNKPIQELKKKSDKSDESDVKCSEENCGIMKLDIEGYEFLIYDSKNKTELRQPPIQIEDLDNYINVLNKINLLLKINGRK